MKIQTFNAGKSSGKSFPNLIQTPESMDTDALKVIVKDYVLDDDARWNAAKPYALELRDRLTQKEWDAFCNESFGVGRRTIEYRLAGGNKGNEKAKLARQAAKALESGKSISQPVPTEPSKREQKRQDCESRKGYATIEVATADQAGPFSPFLCQRCGLIHIDKRQDHAPVEEVGTEPTFPSYTITQRADGLFFDENGIEWIQQS